MVTLVIMAAVGVAAGLAAWWHRQQRRPAPTVVVGEPPSQLDRHDFRAPDADWLIAVFTSATCHSCAAVWSELSAYESDVVVAQNVEVGAEADLHRRYKIESVPTAVIADRQGRTRAAFVGPLGPDDRDQLRTIVLADDENAAPR